MMMALGIFVFQLSTVSYQELQRVTSWRHASNSRVGAAPSSQFVGKGEDSITLTGEIFPEITGYQSSLDLLRAMGDTGKSYLMIEGTGKIYGLAVLSKVQETRSVFFENGGARSISFTVNIELKENITNSLIGGMGEILVGLGGLYL